MKPREYVIVFPCLGLLGDDVGVVVDYLSVSHVFC